MKRYRDDNPYRAMTPWLWLAWGILPLTPYLGVGLFLLMIWACGSVR